VPGGGAGVASFARAWSTYVCHSDRLRQLLYTYTDLFIF